MINERKVRSYCCDDISLIENYDKAISDKIQTWQCHHRAEILPCGRFSRRDLEQHGLLLHRPANELVFLTQFEHKSIHKNHLGHKHSDEAKRKMSETRHGKGCLGRHWKLSDESKKKIGLAMKGNKACKGKVWANNGVISKMFDPDCVPNGWTLGRISWKVSP